MKCPKCNASALRTDAKCKRCGNELREVSDKYTFDKQYRSRFILILKFLVHRHLVWLGYGDGQVGEVSRAAVDVSGSMLKGVASGSFEVGMFSVFTSGFKLMWYMFKRTVEGIAILFGRYQYDAWGRPVRYFVPMGANKVRKNVSFDLSTVDFTELPTAHEYVDDGKHRGIALQEVNNGMSVAKPNNDGIALSKKVENGIAVSNVVQTSNISTGLAVAKVDRDINDLDTSATNGNNLDSTGVKECLVSSDELIKNDSVVASEAIAQTEFVSNEGNDIIDFKSHNMAEEITKQADTNVNDSNFSDGDKKINSTDTAINKVEVGVFERYKKCFIGFGVACALGIGAGVYLGSPKRVVENYIKAVASNDYGNAFEYISFDDSKYITKEKYISQIAWIKSNANLKPNLIYNKLNGEIKKIESTKVKENEELALYKVVGELVSGNNVRKIQYPVLLKKDNNAILGLYAKHKVVDKNIHGTMIFPLPIGTKFVVDGIEVEATIDKEKALAMYKIPDIFIGEHNVKAEHPLFKNFEETFLYDSDKKTYNFTKAFELDSTKVALTTVASKEYLDKFFAAVLKKEKFENVSLGFSKDDSIEKMYKKFTDNFYKPNDKTVSTIVVKDGSNRSWSFDEKGYKVVNRYEFNGTYTRALEDGTPENKEGEVTGTVEFVMGIDNDKFVVTKVNSYKVRFWKM